MKSNGLEFSHFSPEYTPRDLANFLRFRLVLIGSAVAQWLSA